MTSLVGSRKPVYVPKLYANERADGWEGGSMRKVCGEFRGEM